MPINRYEDKSVAKHWNEKYENKYYPYLHGRQKRVLEMLANLNLPEGSSCLELGTGGGQNAIKYAEMGFNVHGVDSSDELLKTADEIALTNSRLTFSNVDLDTRMPFDDASFTCVIVVGTLQYLMEPSTCINEVKRVLKPGGYLIVCQRNGLSFNVLRRPLSFLSCLISSEGFEWGGRNVSTAVGSFEKGTKAVLIKRMVKFSNLLRWFRMADLELVRCEGYTPDFSTSPRLFKILDRLLNLIPFMYRLSHVILAIAKKPNQND